MFIYCQVDIQTCISLNIFRHCPPTYSLHILVSISLCLSGEESSAPDCNFKVVMIRPPKVRGGHSGGPGSWTDVSQPKAFNLNLWLFMLRDVGCKSGSNGEHWSLDY